MCPQTKTFWKTLPTLLQDFDESFFSVSTCLWPCAQAMDYKDMVWWVQCGRTWLALTVTWPQPHQGPLGWTRMFNISTWPHTCFMECMDTHSHRNTPKSWQKTGRWWSRKKGINLKCNWPQDPLLFVHKLSKLCLKVMCTLVKIYNICHLRVAFTGVWCGGVGGWGSYSLMESVFVIVMVRCGKMLFFFFL